MSAVRFQVSIELFMPMAMYETGPLALPNLSSAVERVALVAQDRWRDYARGKPLPDGSQIQTRSGAYMKSILLRGNGAFSAEVFSDSPYAQEIETGVPARDMKTMLDTSMKVRMSKAGKRYLIIPFRWGAYNPSGWNKDSNSGMTATGMPMMPNGVHGAAMAMAASHVKGVGQRESGNGAWNIKTRAPAKVAQRDYAWGGRLTTEQINQAGTFGTMAKRMAGMVKFQSVLGGIGGSKHTKYMTFRVMVEGSSGWIAKAIAGKYPARTVSDEMRPVAKEIFEQALQYDMRAASGQS